MKTASKKRAGWIAAATAAAAAVVGAVVVLTSKTASAATPPRAKTIMVGPGTPPMQTASEGDIISLVRVGASQTTVTATYDMLAPIPGSTADWVVNKPGRAIFTYPGGSNTVDLALDYTALVTDPNTVKTFQTVVANGIAQGKGNLLVLPGTTVPTTSTYALSDVDGNPQNPKWLALMAQFQAYVNQDTPLKPTWPGPNFLPGFPTALRTDGVLDYATALFLTNS